MTRTLILNDGGDHVTEAELVIFVRRYGARDVDRTFPQTSNRGLVPVAVVRRRTSTLGVSSLTCPGAMPGRIFKEIGMSQELIFVEAADGQWFYILENEGAPKDAWDWIEFSQCFGPFPTLEDAQDDEYRSDSDTSGAEVLHFKARGKKSFDAVDRMIADRVLSNPEAAQ